MTSTRSTRKRSSFFAGCLIFGLTLGSLWADNGLVVHEWGYFVENSPRALGETAKSLPRTIPNLFHWTPLTVDGKPISSPRITSRLSNAQTRQFLSSEVALGKSTRNLSRIYSPSQRGESCEPFLYFYADRATSVRVQVGFPGGEPLFWWPPARPGIGTLLWPRVQILSPEATFQPHRWRDDIARRIGLESARQVASNPVRCGNKTDRYLFYEGVVNTNTILQHHQSWDGLHLRNTSPNPLRNILVFLNGKSRPLQIEKIDSQEEVIIDNLDTDKAYHSLSHRAADEKVVDSQMIGEVPFDLSTLATRLRDEGLFADEALAMAKSVLTTGIATTKGTRIIYSIDRDTYDSIHPLKIHPKPEETVRVGMVLSFDLDQAIESSLVKLGGSTLRHQKVRDDLANQLFDIVASRIVNAEPLSDSMRKALKVRTKGMRVLRQIVERPTRSPKKIEDLLGMQKKRLSGKTSHQLEGFLTRQILGHLYAGHPLSPAMTEWIESFRRRNVRRDRPDNSGRIGIRYAQSIGTDPSLYYR